MEQRIVKAYISGSTMTAQDFAGAINRIVVSTGANAIVREQLVLLFDFYNKHFKHINYYQFVEAFSINSAGEVWTPVKHFGQITTDFISEVLRNFYSISRDSITKAEKLSEIENKPAKTAEEIEALNQQSVNGLIEQDKSLFQEVLEKTGTLTNKQLLDNVCPGASTRYDFLDKKGLIKFDVESKKQAMEEAKGYLIAKLNVSVRPKDILDARELTNQIAEGHTPADFQERCKVYAKALCYCWYVRDEFLQ